MGEILGAWEGVLGALPDPTISGTTADVVAVNGARFVLKRIDGLPGLGDRRHRLAAEYRVLLHLRRAGLPVTLPIATDDARLFAAAGSAIYILVPQLPVDADDRSVAFRAIGAVIGRLHGALASYPYDFPSWDIDIERMIIEDALPEIGASLTAADHGILDGYRPQLAGLATQRIHGDCHAGNILVHNGEVSGLIDLDHLPRGPKIYDLAYFLANQVSWAHINQSRDPVISGTRELIAGYTSTNRLTSRDSDALVPVILAIHLRLLAWYRTHPELTGGEAHLDGYRWVAAHAGQLGAAVTA